MQGDRSYVIAELIKAVEEIGVYGEEKYGEHSFPAMVRRGDRNRPTPRHSSRDLFIHAVNHLTDARHGMEHDHFGTMRHQYAAAVFNIMMEFYFAGMDLEAAGPEPVLPATAPAPNPVPEEPKS